MSAQVYPVPDQTEEKRKTFSEWKSIDISFELSLTFGVNVNCFKSVHHPIPTCENREHPGNFQKNPSKLCFQLHVQVYPLLGQTERERKAFLGWSKKGAHIVRLSPRAHTWLS